MEAECPRQIVMEKQCQGLHPTSGLIMAQYDDDDLLEGLAQMCLA